MADKYLKNNGASFKEVEFKQSSAGPGDAGKGIGLDNTGRIDLSMMPVNIGADTKQLMASEILAGGNWVTVWDDGGVFKVRKADATTEGKFADGYVLVGVALGAMATVFFEGPNTQVSGMVPGDVFLSTTAGLGVHTAPSGSGNVVQRLGVAVSATEVNFERGTPTVLA
jgi:hypothetical protein